MRTVNAHTNLKYRLCILSLIVITLTACQIKQAPKTQITQQTPKSLTTSDHLSQLIANAPDSIDAAEAHYRLGLIKIEEHQQDKALGHFIAATQNPDHFPWNIASEIEIMSMNISSEPTVFELLSAKKALLEESDNIPDHLVHRANFHLARWYFADENWESVVETLDAVVPNSLNSAEIVTYFIMNGASESRLGHYQNASDFLFKALDTDSLERYPALIELMDILKQTGKEVKAVELVLQNSPLLTQGAVAEKFMDILDCYSNLEDLKTLIEQQKPGPGFFFLSLKYIDRLAEFDDPVITLKCADELAYGYPDYLDYTLPLRHQLKNAIQVNPEKIGLLLPLSGQLASIGHSIHRGAQLALSDYQQKGGHIPFSLILQDVGDAPETIADAFKILVEKENVGAIVGPVRSAVTEMLLPWCTAYRIPLITPGSSQENIVEKSRWAFRLYPSILYEMRELVQFSVRELGLYRFGCIYPDTDYGQEAYRIIEEIIESEQAVMVFKRQYPRDLATIGAHIGLLSDSSTDIIVIPDIAERAAVVAGHIRYKEALTPTIVGTSAWERPELLDIAGQHLEGSYFVSSYPESIGSRKDISNRYYARFGEQANAFALRGYEAVFLIMSAVEKGVKYRSELRAHFTSEKGLIGLDGPSRFSPSGEYEPPVTVFKIHNSEFTPWRLIPIRFDYGSQSEENSYQNHTIGSPNPGQ